MATDRQTSTLRPDCIRSRGSTPKIACMPWKSLVRRRHPGCSKHSGCECPTRTGDPLPCNSNHFRCRNNSQRTVRKRGKRGEIPTGSTFEPQKASIPSAISSIEIMNKCALWLLRKDFRSRPESSVCILPKPVRRIRQNVLVSLVGRVLGENFPEDLSLRSDPNLHATSSSRVADPGRSSIFRWSSLQESPSPILSALVVLIFQPFRFFTEDRFEHD